MIIDRIEITNFLPFRGTQQINVSPSPSRPVVVVHADNMRGKTSILNALRWAFYERAYKHTGREIAVKDLLNREAEQEAEYEFGVTVEFRNGPDTYRLIRRAFPRQLVDKPQRSADYEITVAMTKNGAMLPLDRIVHEINQVAPEQISRFFLFDGELLDQYEALLVQGSDQGRLIRESIERVLGVPALLRAREDLRLLQRDALKEYEVDEKQAEAVKANVERRNALIQKSEERDEDIAVLSGSIEEMTSEIDRLESELDGAERTLKEAAELESVAERLDEANDAVDEAEADLRNVRGRLWEDVLAQTVEPVLERLAEESNKLVQAVSDRENVDREIGRLEADLHQGQCATCGQSVEQTAKERIEEQLVQLLKRRESLKSDPRRLETVNARQHALREIRSNGAVVSAQAAERRREKAVLDLIRLEGRKAELEEAVQDQDTESLKLKRAKLSALTAERRELQEQLKDAETERDTAEKEANALQVAIERSGVRNRQNISGRRRELYSQLFSRFDASIETLRQQLKDEVQRHATHAFRQMTTQPHYAGLRINESYGLSIYDDEERTISLRSAGAEQVVALSLIDGLHKTGMGTGGVIMDTPFGRLDPNHRRNIVKYLSSTSSQAVLLVHEGELSRQLISDTIADRVARTFEIRSEGVFASVVEPSALHGES